MRGCGLYKGVIIKSITKSLVTEALAVLGVLLGGVHRGDARDLPCVIKWTVR